MATGSSTSTSRTHWGNTPALRPVPLHGVGVPANDQFTRLITNDPRRTVSNPSIPTPPSVVPPTRDLGPREQLGHRPLYHDTDTRFVYELIKLYETQLSTLRISLETAKQTADRARDRVHQLHQRRDGHEKWSAQVTYEAAMESVQGLENSIETLETILERHKGLVHPIRKLPQEILELIMQFTVESEESDRRNELLFWQNTTKRSSAMSRQSTLTPDMVAQDLQQLHIKRHWHHHRYPPPLSLSLVCRRWKDVAIQSPILWKTIHFHLSGQPDVGSKSWERVKVFLKRARHDPASQPAHAGAAGLSLVFTGWKQHVHPPSHDLFKRFMRLLSHTDPTARDWTSVTPAHSRRTSLVDPNGVPALTPLGLNLEPDSNRLTLSPPLMEPPNQFRIDRFEIVFESLCDHRDPLGLNINAEKTWPSKIPKPEEVIFTAKDKVYDDPPHHSQMYDDEDNDADPSGLMTPPYAASLIPWARDVTLCNVQYHWKLPVASRDASPVEVLAVESAYQGLSSLTFLYNRYFTGLLKPPEHAHNLGFLQFMNVAPNLQHLEIRLTSPPPSAGTSTPNTSTPTSVTTGLPHVNSTTATAPAIIHTSIIHITISLHDLFSVLPLFTPDRSRPNAPVILVPSLDHITLLPSRTRFFASSNSFNERRSLIERLEQFCQLTETKIKHLEFARYKPKTSTGFVDQLEPQYIEREDIEFATRYFASCETIEVWGNYNLTVVLDILSITTSKESDILSSQMPTPTATTPVPHRIDAIVTTQLEFPLQSLICPPTTEVLMTSDAILTNEPIPISTSRDSSPPPAPRRRKRTSIFGAKEIIATVIAAATPSKRRSLAIVGTPEGTPKITVNGLPLNPGEDPIAGRVINGFFSGSKRKHMSRAGSMTPGATESPPSLTRQTSKNDSTGASVQSGSGNTARIEGILPKLKNLIVHDADFDHSLIKVLRDRGIEVVTYG